MRRDSILALFLAVATACSGAEGPQGATGSPGVSAPVSVGPGLAGDGSAAQPLSVSFGGTGAAASAARADHAHGAAEIGAGPLAAGVTLDAASVVGTVAAANRALGADDADSLGGLAPASYVTTTALAPYVTAALGPYVTAAAADAAYQPRADYATQAEIVAALSDYALLSEVPVLSSGKIATSVLPAAVPLLDGSGVLPASTVPPTGRFATYAAPPASPVEGAVYYDTATRRVAYWDGAWVPVGLPAMLQFAPNLHTAVLAVGARFTVTLLNVGGDEAFGVSFWASEGFSVVDSTCLVTLPPGALCTLEVEVSSGPSGTRTGIVVASGGSGAVLGVQVVVP